MKDLKYYESLVTKTPQYLGWYNPDGFNDSIHEYPEYVENISDEDKVMATIAAYNKIDMVATYKTICKITGMDRSVIKKHINTYKGKLVSLYATRDEDGLLNGKGWVFNECYY